MVTPTAGKRTRAVGFGLDHRGIVEILTPTTFMATVRKQSREPDTDGVIVTTCDTTWEVLSGQSPEQKPSVGRIVHYLAYGTPGGEFPKTARAAVVTEVPEDFAYDGNTCIGLAVLNPQGMFFNAKVPYAHPADSKGGTWSWPPRI